MLARSCSPRCGTPRRPFVPKWATHDGERSETRWRALAVRTRPRVPLPDCQPSGRDIVFKSR
jgi:hypothetical protein